jgi:hypothetical protein
MVTQRSPSKMERTMDCSIFIEKYDRDGRLRKVDVECTAHRFERDERWCAVAIVVANVQAEEHFRAIGPAG